MLRLIIKAASFVPLALALLWSVCSGLWKEADPESLVQRPYSDCQTRTFVLLTNPLKIEALDLWALAT